MEDYGGFVRAVDERSVGGLRNRLVVGVNVHNGVIDTEQFINLTGGVKGDLAASMVDRSANVSAYVENTVDVRPKVALIGGIQFLHASRERRDRFLTDGDQSGSQTFDLWSPRVGVTWDLADEVRLFANVSRSAEIPTYDSNSFASPSSSGLDAQTATTYEVGARGQGPSFLWDISLYRAEVEDELQCLTTAPWSPCSVVNVDRTIHQGLEAGGSAAILGSVLALDDQVWLNAAYTYNDFTFDADPAYGDNRLPGAPRQYLRAELLYRHVSGLYAGPNIEWSPDAYFADNDNTLEVDAYALWNFKIGYDTGRGWSAYLEGRNLADERYISSVAIAGTASEGSAIFNPGVGRAVYGGLRYHW